MIELDVSEVQKIFKNIKDNDEFKGKLIIEYDFVDEKLSEQWLKSNDFIDKIKYYRIKNRISQRQVCEYIGCDPESYRQYELKNFDIQDPIKAEKIIEFLNLNGIVELPDYFKIKKKYGVNDIVKIVSKFGRKSFIKETGINKTTVDSWYIKDVNEISTYTYMKLVDFFKNNNINFD